MPIEKVIVVEDELIVRKQLELQLRQRRYEVASAENLAQAHELLARDSFDLMFLDVRLPDGQGTELLRDLQTRPQKPLVVITTGFGSVESAVECMRNGAFDYLIKPFSTDQLEITLRRADEFTQLVRVNRFLSHDESEDAGLELLGKSPAMEALRQLIRKVAPTQATVLIQGESGTGKELVARALYRQSPRAHAAFIKVNCASIPENLIESEFFGHERGAFTGAVNKREGRFELAHGGTILLDEVSEVSPQVQAKLLRVLQERELERVGGNRTIKVDVRVIATTNRNLEQSVQRKEFRQDLFFRLNVVPIHVPPLRQRKSDIRELSVAFMHRFARKHGVRVNGISDDAIRALEAHDWPGNVRELQNVIERAVILSDGSGQLEVEQLGFTAAIPVDLTSSPAPTPPPAAPAPSVGQAAPDAGLPESASPAEDDGSEGPAPNGIVSLAELERRQIFKALAHTGGNRTHAARLLGISIRTLRNKLHEYGRSEKDDEGDEGQE
jgi:DNA-binding NtrC family response regulator